jgi:hypothetical protein
MEGNAQAARADFCGARGPRPKLAERPGEEASKALEE